MLSRNVFMALFIPNLFLLHQKLVIVLVARNHLLCILEVLIQQRRRRHRRVSPALDISSPCRILVRNPSVQRHFQEILFRRNMRMGRETFAGLLRLLIHSVREHSREVIRSRSLRNSFVTKFDDPMTDGCQGTKDFHA